GRQACCAGTSSRSSTKWRTAYPIMITHFCGRSRAYSAHLQDDLQAADPADRAIELKSFLRIESWIGGDRDGNPFVTAEVLLEAVRLQSAGALAFCLRELHELGGELSLDGRLVDVADALHALAERSPDRSAQRQDEPYRRA